MKRRNRFLVGLAAAAITYGSLFAFVGPEYWQNRYHHYHGYHHGHHHGCYSDEAPQSTPNADEEVGSW